MLKLTEHVEITISLLYKQKKNKTKQNKTKKTNQTNKPVKCWYSELL